MLAFFWLCLAIAVYTYVGYPLWLLAWSRLRKNPWRCDKFTAPVSIILCVHDEENRIEGRLQELVELLRSSHIDGEIIVVSDGSTDRTVEFAREFEPQGVIVLDRPEKEGKAAALSAGYEIAKNDILVFCDVRQRWAFDALERLLENFADSRVGAVSGDLVVETAPGVMAGVGLYWRFEKWMRKTESRLHSQVGLTGAICATRRVLFRPIPRDTLVDDVYWPLRVAMQGFRVVHDERAVAYDRLPENPRDEFRRKVRTLSGIWQIAAALPSSLLPWRNPVWLAWVSHKLLRLVVPFALLGMLATSAVVPELRWFAVLQALGYALAVAGMFKGIGGRLRLAGAAASFVVLNAAAFLAFWMWISGRSRKSWHKVVYAHPVETPT